MYMSSPVVSADLLVGLSHRNRGQFFCLDPRIGTTLWATKGREVDNVAVLDAGSVVFWLTSDAELIVAKASAKAFELVRRYTVADSSTYAHPVILGDRILVKDVSNLVLWGLN